MTVSINDDSKALLNKISQILKEQGCSLAVVFGSFVRGGQFRDIDIMVAMENGRPPTPEEQLYLAQLIKAATGFDCDVIGIDVPSVLLRAEIAKAGIPLIMENENLWDEFRWRSWIDEKDFRPLIERFYEERFENQS